MCVCVGEEGRVSKLTKNPNMDFLAKGGWGGGEEGAEFFFFFFFDKLEKNRNLIFYA